MRVLVADDHEEMRMTMVQILGQRFDVIDVVASGDALVDAAVALQPDVIVSDISMPNLTGLEAMARLAEAGCASAFVLVTVCTSEALEWINRGALAVVNKFDMHELVKAVDSAAEGFSYLSTRARRVH